jgi:ketosteroid isomerase-like protein
MPSVAGRSTVTPDVRRFVAAYYRAFAEMSRNAPGGMDRWIAFYSDSVLFEDPTAGQSGIGSDTVRSAFTAWFGTGRAGPMRHHVQRIAALDDWIAVDGVLEGVEERRPFRTRFTTWFRLRDGRIAHQIDYMDHETIHRAVRGDTTDLVRLPDRRDATPVGAPARSPRGLWPAIDAYYRAYSTIVPDTASGFARFFAFHAPEFTLEDPTAGSVAENRDQFHAAVRAAAQRESWEEFRWTILRRAQGGDWAVVEGTLTGRNNGKPFDTRFTTWLRVRGDRLIQQIDYADYRTLRKQLHGQ